MVTDLAGQAHRGAVHLRLGEEGEGLRVRAEAVAWWARLASAATAGRVPRHLPAGTSQAAQLFTERGLDFGAAIVAEDAALRDLPGPIL